MAANKHWRPILEKKFLDYKDLSIKNGALWISHKKRFDSHISLLLIAENSKAKQIIWNILYFSHLLIEGLTDYLNLRYFGKKAFSIKSYSIIEDKED